MGLYTGLCRHCRDRVARKRVAPSDADRRFWTERFSMDEICEMAQGIWGGDGFGALTASGEVADRPESAIE